MGKFTYLVNENLEKKVQDMAAEMGIKQMGVTVEVRGIKKSKKDVGIVLKGNDFVETVTNDDSLVLVALYEKAFERVDEQTQDAWIMSLLTQISYDDMKGKVVITKPELNISLGMYRKLGDISVQKAELALLTLQQIADEEKALKAEKSSKKKEKKN